MSNSTCSSASYPDSPSPSYAIASGFYQGSGVSSFSVLNIWAFGICSNDWIASTWLSRAGVYGRIMSDPSPFKLDTMLSKYCPNIFSWQTSASSIYHLCSLLELPYFFSQRMDLTLFFLSFRFEGLGVGTVVRQGEGGLRSWSKSVPTATFMKDLEAPCSSDTGLSSW
jgi:hypothetical protein